MLFQKRDANLSLLFKILKLHSDFIVALGFALVVPLPLPNNEPLCAWHSKS
jgi:hypothetical protein